MDPLTAIGLMANILAFVDFGLKGLNEAKIVYKSSSGLTEEAANLWRIAEQMRRFANNLQTPDPMELDDGEKVLCALAKDCCKETNLKVDATFALEEDNALVICTGVDGDDFPLLAREISHGPYQIPSSKCLATCEERRHIRQKITRLRPRQIIELSSFENKARLLHLLDEINGKPEAKLQIGEEGIKEDEPRSLPLDENRNTGHEAVNEGIGVALEHLGKRAILPKLFAHVFIVRFAATLVSVWLLSQLFELALRQIHA
ncbi:hypothetical protein CPAR01_09942 [Colletotrichum paranaense]|uniref:Uncharacterized protein n=1 Tax=Colletotrichum paranaense TaxID=1914294 RepID=A0ABQ9SCK6_9PEZI|nr:uncharacterized protein CPAR01_09942 [Colletotrichum paranaense]KAK1533234.1 hypothetical protein CPAR01_09942 [Colletotrichum paranaense]